MLEIHEKVVSLHRKSPGGGMVDALVSGASAARRAGSSPVLGTIKVTKQSVNHHVKSLPFIFTCILLCAGLLRVSGFFRWAGGWCQEYSAIFAQ